MENDAPVGLPTISGTPTEGLTLTADASGITDDEGTNTFSYQWQADGTDIVGATDTSFILTQDEVGAVISVRVSYTDGQSFPETLTSMATAMVENAANNPATPDTTDKDAVAQLHNKILSRATQVVVASIIKSVENRIDAAFSGAPQVASYTLDGQTVQLDGQLSAGLRGAMMNKLPTYAQSLQDGTLDWKKMLSDSSFVLPLNATGGDAGNAGLTVWGGGDYTNMSGKAFYMPALVATRYNPLMRDLYNRLLAKGKPKKAALCAVMRKLLVIAYGVLKSQQPFDVNYARR